MGTPIEIPAPPLLAPRDHAEAMRLLGREPNRAELGVFAVMWSEHCAYRHTRSLLATLPTAGVRVIHGPGENAGVLDIGGGLACVFKIESHNHPSAVEPFQGAATGVGGILRDIFAMGAFPVAVLDSLRFGPLSDPKCRAIAEGVAAGIADYSNCIGVPCIGGELSCDPAYADNCLVNVMAVGIARRESLVTTRGSRAGDVLLYYGNPTGREGVHGATFASADLTEESASQRSAVQTADPFMGKKILEATLELIAAGVVVALQDMGAAGLTCSSTELGFRGGLGVELDLDAVPLLGEGLDAYELLLSESQERMLAVIAPEDFGKARAILANWEVGAHVVGRLGEGGRFVVSHRSDLAVDVPLSAVCVGAPAPEPVVPTHSPAPSLPWSSVDFASWSWNEVLLTALSSPNFASKRWIHESFDWQVQLNSVAGPGAGAGVIRLRREGKAGDSSSLIPHPSSLPAFLSLACDGNGLWCALDPYEGTKCVVAEAARNLVASGARPIGATNNLNFGNPRSGAVAWQIAESIRGLGDACRAFGLPVTGGNVSLYNESPRGPILPTPVVGMVGVIDDARHVTRARFADEGDAIVLVGPKPTHAGGSRILRDRLGGFHGPAISCDLEVAARVNELVLALIADGAVTGATDVSEGGLLVALAEMALAGGLGFRVRLPDGAAPAVELLSEEPSRFVLAAAHELLPDLLAQCSNAGIPARVIGRVASDVAEIAHLVNLPMERLCAAWERSP